MHAIKLVIKVWTGDTVHVLRRHTSESVGIHQKVSAHIKKPAYIKKFRPTSNKLPFILLGL